MKRKWLVVFFYWLLCSLYCPGQVYKLEGKNRYTFAQTTFGYDLEYTPAGGYSYYRNPQNQLQKIPIGNTFSPAISITGLHFWGHAEFFTTFSLPDIDLAKNVTHGAYQRFSSTGLKIFILPVGIHKLSPYLGMSLSSFSYKQADGVQMKRADGSILGGFTWSFKKGLLEIGGNYHYKNSYRYYISKTENTPVKVPPLSISADFKYFFDLSLNSLKRERIGALRKEYIKLRKAKALSSVTLAIGPAYSFFTKSSGYNKINKPFLDDHRVSKVYPDIGIGYYHYKLDAAVNLSNRFFSSMLIAYGHTQQVKRNSTAIEVYKFLGDYHGFVPFIGGVVSYEHFRVRETENESETLKRNYRFVSTGIIAGWDIRPTRTDWWGVRTNIRYFPGLKLDMPGGSKINMQQVELNFLQLLIYTGRIYAGMLKKQ